MNTPLSPMTISYIRFSSAIQAQGDSLRRQTALAEQWCSSHGVTLTDRVSDLGVSAFRGSNTKAGLAVFLEMVQKGTIPPGSTLLVEDLDRLSRQQPETSLGLFLNIISAGVRVVTLRDGCVYEAGKLDMGRLMMSVMSMCLAHEESQKKSDRIKASWHAKRQSGEVMSGIVPSWLKIVDGKIIIDEEKAAVVREMVRLSLAGHGNIMITRMINAGHGGIATRPYVQPGFVHSTLQNRALIGELQPKKLSHINGRRVRTPVGPVIEGYYPRIISDDEFNALRHAIASRRHTGGPATSFTNIFTGLLHDSHDGSSMAIQRGSGAGRRYVSAAAQQGRAGASPFVTFGVADLERAILFNLHDHILPSLVSGNDDTNVRVDAIQHQLDALDSRITDVQQAMLDDSTTSTPSVVSMLGKMDEKRKALVVELQTAQGEQAARTLTPLAAVREQLGTLVSYYRDGSSTMTNEQRMALRNAISRVIASIGCTFSRLPNGHVADVTIALKDNRTMKMEVAALRMKPKNQRARYELVVTGQRFVIIDGSPISTAGPIGGNIVETLAPPTAETIAA